MFEKLKRAKSFVIRTKTREELDLSESSHLRRNVAINSSVIDRQKQLTAPARINPSQAKVRLDKQASASHEKIYDDRIILEQIRRINFGDSRSSASNDALNYYYAKKNNDDGERKIFSDRNVRGYHQDGRSKTSERRPRQEKVAKK